MLKVTVERTATIEYTDASGNLIWQLPVGSVAVFAEYTNPNGPLLDDYFLVFAFMEGDQWFVRTASFYANGRDEMLEALSAQWRVPLRFGLCASTDWKSRVIWPEELADQEYFTFTELPAKSLFERLQRRCIGKVYEYSPSAAVQGYVDSRLRPSAPRQSL